MAGGERDARHLARQALKGGVAVAIETCGRQKSCGGIGGQRKVRGKQQVRTGGARTFAISEDFVRIAGEIADDTVDLGNRDLDDARHPASLPSTDEPSLQDGSIDSIIGNREYHLGPGRLKEDTPSIKVIDTLRAVDPRAWNSLAAGHPFLRHEFLHALHETGCACESTGWSPCYLTLWQGASLLGAMPLYVKSHSYGEYVFDWAWADAYHRHGLSYYPKLLGAIPFSPVTGPRLLARDGETRALLVRAALRLSLEVSSLHVLFPTDLEAREMETAGIMLRRSVQFHWENRGYANFDEFLSDLASAKRKKIRQERRRGRETGVQVRRPAGAQIRGQQCDLFQ